MTAKKGVGWSVIIFILAALLVGFVLGTYLSGKPFGRFSGNKIDVILDIIDNDYVDTVNMKNLVEDALPKIVGELDPHSVYIPASDLESVNEELEGHFSGIGVTFSKQQDTIMIVNIISGGPSEKVGLQAGDRIVTIDDSLFVGPHFTSERILKTLRGVKGTSVTVGIKRDASPKLLEYTIIRGDIPVNTVEAAYKVSDGIGLIKINKFGRTTYDEFLTGMANLMKENCSSFIIDLRDNPGGLLDAAIHIINEFLSRGQLIVYTEGKASPRNNAIANGTGTLQQAPLVILMNEISASASEIVAGAIQDNDRGTIIGRPSYGKGLVQNQIPLTDGSALRLTIARYYTPSGRCIQRKYELGKKAEYEQKYIYLVTTGNDNDSTLHTQANTFYTSIGRLVYGGGGIMPDIYVPRDTIGFTSYLNSLMSQGILYEFAFQYTDANRKKLNGFKDYKELLKYLKTQPILENVVDFAESKGIRKRPVLIHASKELINKWTYANIIRNIFGDEGAFPVLLDKDTMIMKAIDIINKGEAFPVASQTQESPSNMHSSARLIFPAYYFPMLVA